MTVPRVLSGDQQDCFGAGHDLASRCAKQDGTCGIDFERMCRWAKGLVRMMNGGMKGRVGMGKGIWTLKRNVNVYYGLPRARGGARTHPKTGFSPQAALTEPPDPFPAHVRQEGVKRTGNWKGSRRAREPPAPRRRGEYYPMKPLTPTDTSPNSYHWLGMVRFSVGFAALWLENIETFASAITLCHAVLIFFA